MTESPMRHFLKNIGLIGDRTKIRFHTDQALVKKGLSIKCHLKRRTQALSEGVTFFENMGLTLVSMYQSWEP